ECSGLCQHLDCGNAAAADPQTDTAALLQPRLPDAFNRTSRTWHSTSPVFSSTVLAMPTKFKLWTHARTVFLICAVALLIARPGLAANQVPKIPRFSVEY